MQRPRSSIAGMLLAVAGLGLLLSPLTQPLDQAVGGALTLVLLTLPFGLVILKFGSERQRALIRSALVGLLKIALILGALGVLSLIVLALRPLLATASVGPLDPVTAVAAGATGLVLLASSYLAAFGRESRRPYHWGFALGGWPFAACGLFAVLWQGFPVLVTTEIVHLTYPHVYVSAFPEPAPSGATLRDTYGDPPRGAPAGSNAVATSYKRFQQVGHCLFTLAIAMACGRTAQRLASSRQWSHNHAEPTDSPAHSLPAHDPRPQPGLDSSPA